MKRSIFQLFVFVLLAFSVQTSTRLQAQDVIDIVITDIDIPIPRWGKQNASFMVENKSDYLRYLAVVTTITFEGVYMNPVRSTRRHVLLEPEAKLPVVTKIEVPGNFGMAVIDFDVYDVFDTLDALIESQRVYHQPITLRFTQPAAMEPYLSRKLSFPPFVTNSRMFDNELCHIVLQMVQEEIEVGDIARRTTADSATVQQLIDSLTDMGVFVRKDGMTRLTFPLVNEETAEKARLLADTLSIELAQSLTKSLAGLPKLRDSLIKAGSLTKDSNDFMGGGQVLYYPYPLVTAMVLWTNLGQRFISPSGPVGLLERNDPCESRNPKYLCAVAGGEFLNGSHYFNLNTATGVYEIQFGGRIPSVICPNDMAATKNLMDHPSWRYPQEEIADAFVFDAALLTPVMAFFEKEPRVFIVKYEKKFEALVTGASLQPTEALRYWFWNLVATATTNRMVKAGTIIPSANQHFKMTLMPKGK